jgi:thiol:disulfide interchange protein DsbA
VVVTEFFSYQCAHCAAFAPSFAAWVKALPADVRVERVPVSLGRPAWEPAGRAYLALVAMNSVEKVDAALFAAIHQQGVRLDTEAQITGWLGKQGIDTGAFTGMYRSFGIDAQYRSSDGKARALRVDGTPTLVIDGRYRIAIEDIGAGREQHYRTQLAVANELIAKARQQRAPAASKAGKAATRQAINLSAS